MCCHLKNPIKRDSDGQQIEMKFKLSIKKTCLDTSHE